MSRIATLEGIHFVDKYIRLATKWLRILPLPPNDKMRNHLVANPIVHDLLAYTNVDTVFLMGETKNEERAREFAKRRVDNDSR